MLTTKEFTQKVEELGYRVGENQAVISIFENNLYAAMTRKDTQFKFNAFFDVREDEKLFNLLVVYAQTPIDKRENKGHIWIKNVGQNGLHLDSTSWILAYVESDNILSFSSKGTIKSLGLQKEYTESEKEEIERKTGVPLVFLDEVIK